MKKKKLSFKIAAFLTLMVMLITTSGFTLPSEGIISEQQARQVADSMIEFLAGIAEYDKVETTPLTDKNGNITYYCFDYFSQDVGQGYILISRDMDNTLIPEYSDMGESEYYLNAKAGIDTLYYTPFDIYDDNDGVIYDSDGKQVEKTEIKDSVNEADRSDNKQVLDAVKEGEVKTLESDSSEVPGADVITGVTYDNIADQWDYLDSIGAVGATANGYATLESKIVHNKMLTSSQLKNIKVNNKSVTNVGHCAITAIANCMLYHRTICCGKFPANTSANDSGYNSMMTRLFTLCWQNNYMDIWGSGGLPYSNHQALIKNAFKSYGYNNANSVIDVNPSWATLTDRIAELGQPFVLGGSFYRSNGDGKAEHDVAVYAYNMIRCSIAGTAYQYRFLKVANGWYNSGRYISFNDFIKNNTYRMITVEPY